MQSKEIMQQQQLEVPAEYGKMRQLFFSVLQQLAVQLSRGKTWEVFTPGSQSKEIMQRRVRCGSCSSQFCSSWQSS